MYDHRKLYLGTVLANSQEPTCSDTSGPVLKWSRRLQINLIFCSRVADKLAVLLLSPDIPSSHKSCHWKRRILWRGMFWQHVFSNFPVWQKCLGLLLLEVAAKVRKYLHFECALWTKISTKNILQTFSSANIQLQSLSSPSNLSFRIQRFHGSHLLCLNNEWNLCGKVLLECSRPVHSRLDNTLDLWKGVRCVSLRERSGRVHCCLMKFVV